MILKVFGVWCKKMLLNGEIMLRKFENPLLEFWVKVEDDEISFWSFLVKITVWSLNFGKLQFGPWSKIRDSEQN